MFQSILWTFEYKFHICYMGMWIVYIYVWSLLFMFMCVGWMCRMMTIENDDLCCKSLPLSQTSSHLYIYSWRQRWCSFMQIKILSNKNGFACLFVRFAHQKYSKWKAFILMLSCSLARPTTPTSHVNLNILSAISIGNASYIYKFRKRVEET